MDKTHITVVLNTSRRCNFRWPPFYMKLLHLFANIIGIMDINPITTSYNERLRFTTVYAACNCSEYIVFAAGISFYFSSQYLEAVRDCLVLYQLYCVWQCRIDLSFIACLLHIKGSLSHFQAKHIGGISNKTILQYQYVHNVYNRRDTTHSCTFVNPFCQREKYCLAKWRNPLLSYFFSDDHSPATDEAMWPKLHSGCFSMSDRQGPGYIKMYLQMHWWHQLWIIYVAYCGNLYP